MRKRILSPIVVMLILCFAFAISESLAASDPIFVQLSPSITMGALYKPDSGTATRVGIVVMHRESNYMNNIACKEFPKRGFTTLCMNSEFVNNESSVDWEGIPLDVAAGVNYLKNVQHMSKIILYGNSGGGITMSFYQAVAENGPSVCQGKNKIFECGDELKGLPPADGIILSDGHPGNPILRLRSINPSLIRDKDDPSIVKRVNQNLDPFDPLNGYNPTGPSTYSDKFKKKYFAAQAEEMNRLIYSAQDKLLSIDSGGSFFTDDAPFSIAGFDNARLMSLDPSIRHTTIRPEQLLKNDRTIAIGIIPSLAPSRPELAAANKTFSSGARGGLTLRSFLSSNAIFSGDSMDETKIDLCSSNNSTPCMLQSVSAPLLVIANQASFQNLIVEDEISYLKAKSKDKDFIVVEGATTGSTACTNCALPASTYSNATLNTFDYAAAWINARFR